MYHESFYRVSYADTDQMGVVYYANYFTFFERSRTEMLRDCGLPYSEMEQRGVILPVVEAHCHYHQPARYDDLLTFKTALTGVRGVRLTLTTEVWRGDEKLVTGVVVLACVNQDRKLIRIPADLLEACQKYTQITPVETK